MYITLISRVILFCPKLRGNLMTIEMIQDKIINTIEIIVNKTLEKYIRTRDVVSAVTGIRNDKYEITIDGKKYWVKDGVNISPKKGTMVWVRIPDGKINMAYIEALK